MTKEEEAAVKQETNGRSKNGQPDEKAPGAGGGKRNRGKRNRSRSPLDRGGKSSNRGNSDGSRTSRRVYVANVPFDVKWTDLKDLFKEKVGNVVYAQLFEDEQGRNRGCGLVEFSDAATAKKAIETMHRYNFKNRELVVKEDLDCERDRYGRLLLSGKGDGDRRAPGRDHDLGGGVYHDQPGYAISGAPSGYAISGGPSGTWNTYGLSPQFLESCGVEGQLNNRIFVANLDYKVGEKKLEEIFRLAGKVLRVRLYCDSTGQSKGHGTVEYEHPVEAVQAISMFHDQNLYGRPMSIRMDKYEIEDTPTELPTKLPSGLEGVGKGLGIGGQPLNVSKSLLCANAPAVAIPVQPPLPPPAPIQAPPVQQPPQLSAGALSGLAGSLGQMQGISHHQGMHQQVSQPPIQQAVEPSYHNSAYGGGGGLNIAGLDSRTLTNLVNSSGLANTLANSGLSGLQTNNVLASLTSSGSLRGVGLASSHSGLGNQNTGGAQNTAGLSVYSTYEPEFRRDLQPENKPPQYSTMRPAMSDTIVVRNLPANFSWQNLQDRFNEMGEVRYAELKGPGTALVRFTNARSAQRAVDIMHGMRIENRSIEVNFYY